MKKYVFITFFLHCFSVLLYNAALSQTDLNQFSPRNLSGTLDSGFTGWQWYVQHSSLTGRIRDAIDYYNQSLLKNNPDDK